MEFNEVLQNLMEVDGSSGSMHTVNHTDLQKTNTSKASTCSSKINNKRVEMTEYDLELNSVLKETSEAITEIFESTSSLNMYSYEDELNAVIQSCIVHSPKTDDTCKKNVNELKKDHNQTKEIESLKSDSKQQSLEAKNKSSSKNELVIQSKTKTNTTALQTNDATMNITNNKICGSLREISDYKETQKYVNNFGEVLMDIFKLLELRSLFNVSKVSTVWNMFAMSDYVWENIKLKNSKITNWEQFIDIVDRKNTIKLDTRNMDIPNEINENKHFWLCFTKAIRNATSLKAIELYRSPTHVVENTMYSLRQLEVFKATTIEDQSINSIEYMTLSLNNLNEMKQLTEIRIKGLSTGINLSLISSFSKLKKLKILSLTSIKSFPKKIVHSLLTLNEHLEVLEIGDCDCLSKDFTYVLAKLVNLTSLRLENCTGEWINYGKDIFHAIRRLKNLQILELINIQFSIDMEHELEKCGHIKALLIIPDYKDQSSAINIHIFNSLKKLSNTLSYLVWGITNESFHDTGLVDEYLQSMFNVELLKKNQASLPTTSQPGETTFKIDKEIMSRDFNTFKVQELEKLFKTVFENVKTKFIKIPFSAITEVNLANEFKDIITKNKTK